VILARLFSYADAHGARMGVNYRQIPVKQPKVPLHSYGKDGLMRVQNVADPVYAPNSKGTDQLFRGHPLSDALGGSH
jgi:catalase